MKNRIAVLLTCHNRKHKTLKCLRTLSEAHRPTGISLEVFLVDDGCTDGTADCVRKYFPETNIIKGSGNLYWAGGMRLAFGEAINSKNYDGFLLLNDDVELNHDFLFKILETKDFCLKLNSKGGLYSGSTLDKRTNSISYGGNLLTKGISSPKHQLLQPTSSPQPCHLTNANILYIENEVIEKIGFFDKLFFHGFADYDFSLRAYKAGFPVYITPDICGYCEDDHGNSWSDSKSTIQRIKYLKSPLGLAYKDYTLYVKRHFPRHFPIVYVKLWLKTLFPLLWRLKNDLGKG